MHKLTAELVEYLRAALVLLPEDEVLLEIQASNEIRWMHGELAPGVMRIDVTTLREASRTLRRYILVSRGDTRRLALVSEELAL